MAKVSFNKLNLNKTQTPQVIEYAGNSIEVKTYLPIEEKLELAERIINSSVDDNGYYNDIKINIYAAVERVLAYTNISVTEKQAADVYKLYDSFVASGLLETIDNLIENDFALVRIGVYNTIDSIYDYKNSAVGMLDALSDGYEKTKFNVEAITSQIKDPEALGLLKDILTKLS